MLFRKFKILDILTNFLIVFTIILIVYFANARQSPREKIRSSVEAAATITPEELKEELYVISSDSMEGRKTGSLGQEKAARYIAGRFKEMGLQPVVINNRETYYQEFDLIEWTWGDIIAKAGDHTFRNRNDFLYIGSPTESFEIRIPLIFIGFGYADEYNSGKIKNKGVVLLAGGGEVPWRENVRIARSRGAAAVFVIYGSDRQDFSRLSGKFSYFYQSPTLHLNEDITPEKQLVYLSPSMAEVLFHMPLEQIFVAAEQIHQHKEIASSTLTSRELLLHVERNRQIIRTTNVLGYVPGKSESDELVVVTAHYDHLGIRNNILYPGADDNASGASALLEVAEAFSMSEKSGMGTRRSALFVALTGEEEGLFGSQYYVDHPVFPLDRTVAAFNIDMIGRRDEIHPDSVRYVYVIGSDKMSDELRQILEYNNNKHTQLQLDYTYDNDQDPNRFYYRSDHYNFARHGIPVIFYFTGVHADYHRPTDTADKIRYDQLVDISKLIFYTSRQVADNKVRLRLN